MTRRGFSHNLDLEVAGLLPPNSVCLPQSSVLLLPQHAAGSALSPSTKGKFNQLF
jgi:hypothetical protein